MLRTIDPVNVARFLKERERYEIEIAAKQVEVPTLKVLPYTASVDRTLLKSLFYMGKFDDIAPDIATVKDLTTDHIETYVRSLISRSDTTIVDPTIIESALCGFAMPTMILDADARITTYCADFFERLESVVCGLFPENNPKKSVQLPCSRLEPPILKKEIWKRLEYDETLEKSVKVFIKVLTQEAINCQAYGHNKSAEKTKQPGRNRKERSKDENPGPSTSLTSKKTKPICLYPPHKAKGFRHYLKDCRDCPDDQKDKLFEEICEHKNRAIKRTTPKAEETPSSVIFSATFAEKVRTTVCADIGACASLMDSEMLSKFEKAGVEAEIKTLPRPVTFNMAAKNADGTDNSIMCARTVTIDTQLHIRHGSALILRGLHWFVTPQMVGQYSKA